MKKLITLIASIALTVSMNVQPVKANNEITVTAFEANTKMILLTTSEIMNDDSFDGNILLIKQGMKQNVEIRINEDKKNIEIIPDSGIEPGVGYTLSVSGDDLTEEYTKRFKIKIFEYGTVSALGGKGWDAENNTSSSSSTYDPIGTGNDITGYNISVPTETNFIFFPTGTWAWNKRGSSYGMQDYTFSVDVTPTSDTFDLITMMRADDLRWWNDFPEESGYTTYPEEIMLRCRNNSNELGTNVNGIGSGWTALTDNNNLLDKDIMTNITMSVNGDNLKVYIGGEKVFDEITECIHAGVPGFGINTGTSVKLENMTATYAEELEYLNTNILGEVSVDDSLEIEFSYPVLDKNIKNYIIISDTGGNKIEYSINTDDNEKFIIRFTDKLKYKSEYIIRISDELMYKDHDKKGKFGDIKFVTEKPEFDLQQAEIKVNGKTVTELSTVDSNTVDAYISIKNNRCSEKKEGVIIAALYKIHETDIDELVDIKVKEYSLDIGEEASLIESISADKVIKNGRYKVVFRVLSWNDVVVTEFSKIYTN